MTWRSSRTLLSSTAGRWSRRTLGCPCSSLVTPWEDLLLFWCHFLHRCRNLQVFTFKVFLAQQRPIVLGMVLVGPLIKADPSYATPMMKIIASAVSSFFPSYELSEATTELLTSDVVRNNNVWWYQHFLERLKLTKSEEIPLFIKEGLRQVLRPPWCKEWAS